MVHVACVVVPQPVLADHAKLVAKSLQFAVSVMVVPAGGLDALDVSVHVGAGGGVRQVRAIDSGGVLVPMPLVAVTV